MAARLRIGVIGLGRRWPRYRQALLALKREATVQAIYDPSLALAREQAASLGCPTVGGVVELLQRDDIDAVIFTGGAWFGLWPLEHAARVRKPILCAASLVRDDAHADALRQSLDPAAPIHMTLWPGFDLLCEAADTPLGETLGSPRLALAGHVAATEGDPLMGGAALALLDGLAGLFESAPRTVSTVTAAQPGFVTVVLDFDEGCVGQLSLWSGSAGMSRTWLDIDAEAGALRAELPRQLTWHDAEGRHELELPGGLAELWVVDRFVRAVRQKEAATCSFARAYQALTWLRAARRSRKEGKSVKLEG
jgi:predicted dehydrogenase